MQVIVTSKFVLKVGIANKLFPRILYAFKVFKWALNVRKEQIQNILLIFHLLEFILEDLRTFYVTFKYGYLYRVDSFLVLFLLKRLSFEESDCLKIAISGSVMEQRVLAWIALVDSASFFDDFVKEVVVMISDGNHSRGSFIPIRRVDGSDFFFQKHL